MSQDPPFDGYELPFEVEYPCTTAKYDEPIADSVDVAIRGDWSRDSDRVADDVLERRGDWALRSFDVYGREVYMPGRGGSTGDKREALRRAYLAAACIERFGADLKRSGSAHTISQGVPIAVAADGKPAIATWLFARGWDVEEIADELDVGEPTVSRYFSRIRSSTSFAEGSD